LGGGFWPATTAFASVTLSCTNLKKRADEIPGSLQWTRTGTRS
jgi:hypothetical protein